MKVIVVGDIHGDFGALNQLINKKHPDVLIQLGDNAYFWTGKQAIGEIKPQGTKIYLLSGNHEDWNLIEKKVGRHNHIPIEVEENIFYCPIGSELEINNKRIMFVGGADSIDKAWRTLDIDWFYQETLNDRDLDFCLQTQNKIDVICSHTCPFDFRIFEKLKLYNKANDPTSHVLNTVLEHFKPERWYFGHFHDFAQGQTKSCRWWCLNYAPHTKWWMETKW